MKAKRLTAQNAAKLLAEFYEAHGAEQMKASYGWDAPPTVEGRGKRYYAFYYDKCPTPLGWGAVEMRTWDSTDDNAYLSVGVFPAYQRQGYFGQIMTWLANKGLELGADFASQHVLKSNEAHYARVMRLAHTEGSAWIYAGDAWYPAPGSGYFVYPLSEKKEEQGKSV